MVRAVALTLGVIISTVLVTGIIFAGSILKYVYDQMDAREKARAQQRQAAPRGPEGSIPVVISPDQPEGPGEADSGSTERRGRERRDDPSGGGPAGEPPGEGPPDGP